MCASSRVSAHRYKTDRHRFDSRHSSVDHAGIAFPRRPCPRAVALPAQRKGRTERLPMRRRSSLFAAVAGPRAKWIVFGVWFVVIFASFSAGIPEKYTDAQENESTSFLPGDAESTKALIATEDLQGGELAPAVILYRRESGLTAADKQKIVADVGRLTAQALPGRRARRCDSRRGRRRTAAPRRTAAGRGLRRPDHGDPWPAERLRAVRRPGVLPGRQGRARVRVRPRRRRVRDAARPGRVLARDASAIRAAASRSRSPAAPAMRPTRSRSSRTSTARCSLAALLARDPADPDLPLADLPVHPAGAVIFAEFLSQTLGYGLAEPGVTINGQSSAIMSILVLGAGTDYALLIVARYREEMHREVDKYVAMRNALISAGPAVFASAATVIAALFCLSLARVNGTSGLGPLGALGVFCAALSMLTLLPALLLIFGRRAFWPFVPHTPRRARARASRRAAASCSQRRASARSRRPSARAWSRSSCCRSTLLTALVRRVSGGAACRRSCRCSTGRSSRRTSCAASSTSTRSTRPTASGSGSATAWPSIRSGRSSAPWRSCS